MTNPPGETGVFADKVPDQVIAHANLYWRYQIAPGRSAGTMTTADVGG
jgi:hypothetical protein